MNRHRITFGAAVFIVLSALLNVACADDDARTSEAFGMLAREQSLAESYVVLLNTVGKEDFERYTNGIRLYARAKAEFDRLIAQMKHDIVHREPFAQSEKFQAVLQSAVAKRMAFTRHVDETVDALVPPGTRAVTDYIEVAEQLIAIIQEAAGAIWEKYWSVRETRREETLAQLEALKWKPFHAIGG